MAEGVGDMVSSRGVVVDVGGEGLRDTVNDG